MLHSRFLEQEHSLTVLADAPLHGLAGPTVRLSGEVQLFQFVAGERLPADFATMLF